MLIAFGVLALFSTVPLLSALANAQDAWTAFFLILVALTISSLYSSISAVVKAELFPVEIRALGVLAAQYGSFAPHLNAGYAVRSDETRTDAILLTVGMDNLLTDWATLAAVLGFLIVLTWGTALALLFSAANVFARDFSNIVQTLTAFVHFSVPMIYPFTLVPERFGEDLVGLYLANPLAEAVLLMQRGFWVGVTDDPQATMADHLPEHLWTRGLVHLGIALVVLVVAWAVLTVDVNEGDIAFPQLLDRCGELGARAAQEIAQRSEDPQFLIGDTKIGLGRSAGEIGNTQDEIKHLDHVVERFPGEVRFVLAQGIARDRDFPDDAVQAYRALQEHPDAVFAHRAVTEVRDRRRVGAVVADAHRVSRRV